jgi:uncharacterized protein (DUF433 family)
MSHPLYDVIDFEIVGDYTLRVVFDDHTEQIINFEPVLKGEVYGPLKDLELFNQVKLDQEVHTLVWPNGADFDPWLLHEWPKHAEKLSRQTQHWQEKLIEKSPQFLAEPATEYQMTKETHESPPQTIDRYIVITPGIGGGRPRIAGRRIKVKNIVIAHERMGWSVDQIAEEYDLTLAEIYAALAYYFDQRPEIDADIRKDDEFAEQMRKQSPSKLAKKLHG